MRIHLMRNVVVGLCCVMSAVAAHADSVLENWRAEVSLTRNVADNDIQLAYKEAQHLKEITPLDATAEDQARILNLLARIEVYLADTAQAEQHAKAAFDLAQKHDDRIGQAEADLNIALNSVNQSRFDAMSAAIRHSMDILDGVDQPVLQAEAMLRTSMMFRRFGRLDDSVETAMQLLEMAKHSDNFLVHAYAYQGMAISYDQSDHRAEARDYYIKMRGAAQDAHSKLLEGDALLGLGSTISSMGELKKGERLIREGIALTRKTGGPFYLAHALHTLTDNLQKQGRLSEAEAALSEEIGIYRNKTNRVGLWWALRLKSEIELQRGKLAEASADAEAIYQLSREMGHPYYLGESAKILAADMAKKGEFKRAYRLQHEAEEMSAKNARETASVRMLDLANRYEESSRQRQLEEFTLERERHGLQQRWLWTVLLATITILGVMAYSFVHLRRNHRRLQALHGELAVSSSKLQATLEALPDLMFELDANGTYLDVYAAGKDDLLIAPSKHLIGKRVHDVLPAATLEVCYAAMNEAREFGTSFGKQYELVLNGKAYWFELSVARKGGDQAGNESFIMLSRDITESKRLQDEIRMREQYQRALLDNFPFMVWLKDTESRLLAINRGYLSAAGLPGSAEYFGKTDLDLFPKELAEKFISDDREVMNTGQQKTVEELVGVPGSIRWHETWKSPVYDQDGKLLGTVGFARDITQIKEANRLLHEQEQAIRAVVENSPDFIVRYDSECRRTYMNPAIQAIFGIPQNQAIGTTPSDYSTLPEEYLNALKEVLASGRERRLETSYLAGNDEASWVDLRMAPEFGPDGKVVSVLAIGRDITVRKRTERELVLLNSAVNASTESIFLMNELGHFVYVNDAACRNLGYGREELLGMTPLDIDPDISPEQFSAMRDSLLAHGPRNSSMEARHRTRDGRIFPIEIAPSSIMLDGKHYMLAMARDITERKAAEQELRQYREHLEELVHKRTLALYESETRYRYNSNLLNAIIESPSSSVSIYALNREYRFLAFNSRFKSAARRLWGAEVELGMNILDIIHTDAHREFSKQGFDHVLAGNSGFLESKEVRVEDGKEVIEYTDNYGSPIYNDNGEVIGLTVFVLNVTERKRIEAALQESEARYRQQYNLLQGMLESSLNVSFYALDREYRYLAFNASHRQEAKLLWGTEPRIGQNWLDGIHAVNTEEHREFCRQGFDRVLGGESYSIESVEKVMIDDGQVIELYFDNFGSPIRNDAGEVIGLTVFSVNITQRKATELKLKETLELTEGVINAIPDILFEVDREGRYLNVWTRHPELLAVERARLLGKTVHEVLAPDFAAAAMRAIREADELGVSLIEDVSLDLPQGTRWFSHSLSKKMGSTPDKTTYLVLSRDITERKLAEEEVRQLNAQLEQRVQERTAELAMREREFRTLAENIPDHIIRYDRQARKTYINTATAQLMGVKAEAILALTPEETPEEMRATDMSAFAQHLRRVLETGEPQELELTLRHAELGMRIHHVRFVPECDECGEVIGALMVGHDITALKAYEQELKEREQRYHEIFDNAVEGMYLLEVTEDGRFRNIDLNPALCKSVGIPREAMIGKYVDEAVSAETGRAVNEKYRRCVAFGESIEEATELDLPTGKRYFYSTVTPIYFNGRVHRLIGISRDITELKRVERELNESREQLRGLMAQREAAREDERKRIAREVHDELGQILTGLKINVSLLSHQLGKGAEDVRERLKEALLLTDRSLEVARNVASSLRPAALDMGIISALEWLAERFGRNTGIICKLLVDDKDIHLPENSAITLFRIAQESLTNVARHSQAKRVEILLRKEADDYLLKVSDNGKGFDLKKKKSDSFGLVGIRERAHLLGGTVKIESRLRHGTIVEIRIPVQNTLEEA